MDDIQQVSFLARGCWSLQHELILREGCICFSSFCPYFKTLVITSNLSVDGLVSNSRLKVLEHGAN